MLTQLILILVVLDIGSGMQLDMRLVSSPVFGSSYLQSPQKVCVFLCICVGVSG